MKRFLSALLACALLGTLSLAAPTNASVKYVKATHHAHHHHAHKAGKHHRVRHHNGV